jgi:CHAT domain-containing protein/Tfp pilus assembly protein PilF
MEEEKTLMTIRIAASSFSCRFWPYAVFSGLALFIFSYPASTHARRQNEPATLTTGQVIEREVSGGQRHVYQIQLPAGHFVEAFVQQQGAWVAVSLHAPNGQTLGEYDEPVGENAKREILFLSHSEGLYQFVVRPARENAPAARYQIKVVIARPALEADGIRVRATSLVKEARMAYWKSGPLSEDMGRKFAEKFEEALGLWQSLDDRWMLAETYLDLGILNARMFDYAKALELYEKSLPLFPDSPEGVASKATALNNIADVHRTLGEPRKALDYFRQCLELKKPGRSRAISLDNIGGVYYALSDYQQALDHMQQALTTFRSLGLVRDEAVALNNLGNTWGKIGDLNRSREYLSEALTLIRKTKDKHQEATYLNNLGNCSFSMGDYGQALDYARQSIEINRAIRNSGGEADGLTLLCRIYNASGEAEKAMEACQGALTMHRKTRDRLGEQETLSALRQVHARGGDTRNAIASGQQALSLIREIGDPGGELSELHALGKLAAREGDLSQARERIEQAIQIGESLRAKAGSRQLRSSYLAGLQGAFESYVDLLMQLNAREPGKGHEQRALQFSERARARGLLDLLAESRAEIRQGADREALEKERSLLERLNAKDAAWKRLRNNERTKAQADLIAGEINDLTTQLQVIEAQVRASSPRYAALTQSDPLTAAEIQQQLLDDNTVLLEYALGEKQSWLWAVTRDSLQSFQLPARADIESAARDVYRLLTARQPQKDLSQAEHLKQIVEADAKLPAATAALSRMLLDPVSTQLQGEWKNFRLAIVASGALEYVPFAALSSISNHEIAHLPSASALALLRQEAAGRQAPGSTLAVLADPVFEAGDPRLVTARKKSSPQVPTGLLASVRSADALPAAPILAPDLGRSVRSFHREGFGRLVFSSEEADFIAKLAPRRSTLKATGFAANRQLVTSGELGRYRIVHFATHGLINSEHPELSGLVLSLVEESGKPQDGFLRMHELFNLHLPADLVVLSACQTALGKEIKGEGLVGLTRGFMYAGAQRVVASLWQVDDQATAQLMQAFYRGMLKEGLRPAAALRAAQLEMSKQKRWSSPYYWAGFVLQGEWK